MSGRSSSRKSRTSTAGSTITVEYASESALSPTSTSRIEEKEQLQHLNDRLSAYIDRVRSLETENARLSFQIRTTEESVTTERDNLREAYEAELSDARKLLDDTAKDRARFQIEADRLRAKVDELTVANSKLERDLKDAEGARAYAESQLHDAQGKASAAAHGQKAAEDEARKLRKELESLKLQLERSRAQLEEESLLRVDLENRLQSLREELNFNKQIFEQELAETRRKKQTDIVEINTQLEDEYNNKLQEGLQEMREQFDIKLRMNRRELEDMYDRRMDDSQLAAERNATAAASSREELKRLKMQWEAAEKDRVNNDNAINALEKKVRDLEGMLAAERDGHYSRMAVRDDDIRRLKAQIEDMDREYKDLMDTKVRLDVEIEAYRKLLESEETRLNMSSPTIEIKKRTVTSSSSRTSKGTKRKRVSPSEEMHISSGAYTTTSNTSNQIDIIDHDIDGQFVKIQNNGDEDISMSGWQLKRSAGEEEVIYKFHRSFVLKAGKIVTVWSSDSEVTHSPPTDLVMKNQQWPTGDSIRSVLISPDADEEVASRESTRNTRTSHTTESYSYRSSGGRIGTKSSSMSSGTYYGEDGDQKCSIM